MFRAVMLSSLILLAVLFGALSFSNLKKPADFTYASQQINTLDPQQMSWNSDIQLCTNLWEGLVQLDPHTLGVTAGMAHLPPAISADHTVYTFQLRSDSRWSNGDAIGAADFVRGWQRAIEPGTAADYAFLVRQHIRGAQEYYDWRNRAIRALSWLRALSAGEVLQKTQREALTHTLQDAGINHIAGSTPPWPELRTQFLKQHDAQRRRRLEQVGIKAPNATEFQVTLNRPTPYFLELTTLPVFMPVHESIERLRLAEEGLDIDSDGLVTYDTQWTKPDYHANGYPGLITNNVFTLSEWQFRSRVRLSANPYHYYRDRVAVDQIDVLMFEHENTAFMAYEAGVVKWLPTLNVEYTKALLQLADSGQRDDIHLSPAFGTYFFNLNCADATLPDGRQNPFIDRRVRQAFSIAVDRELLSRRVAIKQNPPSEVLVPVDTIRGYESPAGLPYDLPGANDLLDKAGYKDRNLFPEVSILYSTGSEHGRIAEALASMWTSGLGVKVRLEGKERKTFGEDKQKRNYHIARGGWYGDYADPTTFLDIFRTGNGNNDSGYSNEAYDTLLAEAAGMTERRARMRKLAQAESMLITEEFPIIPIWQYTNAAALKPTITGIIFNPRERYPLRHVQVSR